MENHQVRQLIRRELPSILQQDPEMRAWVLSPMVERRAREWRGSWASRSTATPKMLTRRCFHE